MMSLLEITIWYQALICLQLVYCLNQWYQLSSVSPTLQMFAGIYRDFAGKSECRDFKFTGIACILAIPVISEVNQKKVWTFYTYSLSWFFNFFIIFVGISGVHVILVIIKCTLQGMFCDTGIPRTFYGGKICSVFISQKF